MDKKLSESISTQVRVHNPKGAGRKKGVPNKARKELMTLVEEKYPGWHPVLALIDLSHDKTITPELKHKVIVDAASFCIAKPKAMMSIDTTIEAHMFHQMFTQEDLTELIDITE
jgi:hypothetical protein